jgi:hypothetical protein
MSDVELTPLQKRLAEAKAKLAAVAAEDQAFDEAVKAEREPDDIEQKAADIAAWTDAKKKHGFRRVALIETEMGAIIVKAPHEVSYKEWQDSELKGTISLEKLALPCVIYPAQARLDKILSDYPATTGRLADAVVALAGFRRDDHSKKS